MLIAGTGVECLRSRGAHSSLRAQYGEGYYLSDQLLGWRLKPNVNVTDAEGKVLFRTDRYGFRNSNTEFSKRVKAMLFGDSFVQGYYLNEDELISTEMRKRLNSSVLNFGMGGYSTDQEFILAREALKKFETEWVVLFLYSNDLPYLNRTKAWRKEKPRFLIKEGVVQFETIKSPSFVEFSGSAFPEDNSLEQFNAVKEVQKTSISDSRVNQFKQVFKSRLNRVGAFLAEPKRLWEALGRGILLGDLGNLLRLEIEPQLGRDAYRKAEVLEPYWNLDFQFLTELNRLSLEKGSRLLVFFIPEYAQIERGERYFEPQRGFLRWCAKTQLECLEPHVEYAKTDAITPLYFRDDGHFTAAGAKLAATLVSEYIQNHSKSKSERVGMNGTEY